MRLFMESLLVKSSQIFVARSILVIIKIFRLTPFLSEMFEKAFDDTNCVSGVSDVSMNGWSSGSGSGQLLLVHRTIARQIHLLNEIGKGRYWSFSLVFVSSCWPTVFVSDTEKCTAECGTARTSLSRNSPPETNSRGSERQRSTKPACFVTTIFSVLSPLITKVFSLYYLHWEAVNRSNQHGNAITLVTSSVYFYFFL